MSRIGQSPVSIKENVKAILENKLLKLKGPKGFLEMKVSNSVDLKINDDNILIENKSIIFRIFELINYFQFFLKTYNIYTYGKYFINKFK